MTQKFLVILTDECGHEFSVEIRAEDRDDAWETVQMDYPESCVDAVIPASSRLARYEEDYSDPYWDEMDDGLSSCQKEMNDRLDMGRNEAGEWVGFM